MNLEDDDLLIDFSDCDVVTVANTVNPKSNPNVNTDLYLQQGLIYDDTTTEYYRVIRNRKISTIMQDDIGFYPEKSFKFPYMWDPYTGERMKNKNGTLKEDPYGPLYFHPDDLIHYYYLKRLDKLWCDPKDEAGGYFQGWYDDGVGSGKDMFLTGRGSYTELYLFRLPIHDCYLHPDHDMSLITMGPELTIDEINEIENLAETNYTSNYKSKYGKPRPSLKQIKALHDQAISKTPDLSTTYKINRSNEHSISKEKLKEYRDAENRLAVDKLKKM